MKKLIKVLGIFILILLILSIIAVAVGYFYLRGKLSKMQQISIDEENLGISEVAEENLSGYRNIAIFGVDSRDSDLGAGNRSDCIIIASINNKTKEIRLISVYRDTYVNIDGYGLDKINHAYSYGGPELAIKTLNENLDLNITEFVTVNFDSLAEAVNALGGITVNISSDEIDALNSVISDTASTMGVTAQYISSSGNQVLDGVQAVSYARVRKTSGGDYRRTERMRTVIEAMFKEIKTKSLTEINDLADQILPELYTNLSPNSIIMLAPTLLTYEISDSIGWPYNVEGITLDRWYGVPVTLESNVTKLHQELFGEEDYSPSETVQEISDKIIQKTGYSN